MYTAEEQAEHRKQWVDALRSGKYQQGRGLLRDGNKFCCLGVACDISGLGAWVTYRRYTDFVVRGGHTEQIELPDEVMEWLGVQHNDVMMNNETSLSKINDDGTSFNEIADIIESGRILT